MAAKEPRLKYFAWRWGVVLWLAVAAAGAFAADITRQAKFGIDASGALSIADVERGALPVEPLEPRSFNLGSGALWLRIDVPQLDASRTWFLQLSGSTVVNRASLFTRDERVDWKEQRAGDHVPVSQWTHPAATPVFALTAPGSPAWLRIENAPGPASAFLQLLDGSELEQGQRWTYLLVGMYVGFGALVLLVGLMHGRLYRDRAFYSYCTYVLAMLMFQLAYTGLGGLFIWPHSAALNDAAPAFFMLAMTAAGIWNIREAVALRRHSRAVDRFTIGFILFGAVFALAYNPLASRPAYALLNVYGLSAVILSITLCLWTWRRGERYSGWLFLGFLPVHLAYPFPALRAAGVLADSWATQYAVLIGSAVEIPLLLYILHWRAKDFSENRARLAALDSTDPLTGLTTVPVLMLRLRDAMLRAQRLGHSCALLVVDLANHGEIVARGGRTAGDRALVIAASRLSRLVREIDTVCRIGDTRFAVLVEGPLPGQARGALAQHIIARGLEPVRNSGGQALQFRVVTASLPDAGPAMSPKVGGVDEQVVLQRVQSALDELMQDPRRVLQNLEPSMA